MFHLLHYYAILAALISLPEGTLLPDHRTGLKPMGDLPVMSHSEKTHLSPALLTHNYPSYPLKGNLFDLPLLFLYVNLGSSRKSNQAVVNRQLYK